jgi:hypothetical protein
LHFTHGLRSGYVGNESTLQLPTLTAN